MISEDDASVRTGAETIDLQEGNSRGILLLHGFGDTPQTLKLLALDLHSAGFAVKAPLLPGHGRRIEDFVGSRRQEWLSFARAELNAMKERYKAVALVGLSMGGAIAAILAAENHDTPALVMLAPYVDMPRTHKVASAAFWLWGGNHVKKSNSPGSIRDPIERAKNVGYGAYTPRLLYELWRVGIMARKALAGITSPTRKVTVPDCLTTPRPHSRPVSTATGTTGMPRAR